MAPTEISKQKASPSSKSGFFYIAELAIRVLAIGFTLSGAIIMITSKQFVSGYGMTENFSYTTFSSLRFMVGADIAVCGLTILSAIHVIALNRPKTNPKNYFYLLLHDLVSVLLLLSGLSGATAVGYVGRYGQEKTGWIKFCDYAEQFCNKIMVSLGSSFVAVVCLFVLTVMSVHKLKSAHAYFEGI